MVEKEAGNTIINYKNNFKPKQAFKVDNYHLETPAHEYDINFNCPIPNSLESSKLILEPFIPSLHAEQLFHLYQSTPAIFDFLPVAFPEKLQDSLTFFEQFRLDPSRTLFVVYDKSGIRSQDPRSEIAGLIGVLKVDPSPATRSLEIGPVITFPNFQRTHVTRQAVGCILRWSFDTLNFRRVQWFANELNVGSVKTAEKNGFKREGRLLWERCVPVGKVGVPLPEAKKEEEERAGRGLGRHSILLAIGWDEWDSTVRASVEEILSN
ncbi:acyl-CoA N-acyltransferase [Meredithblackwellia eburnea MCA 4105]